MRWTEHRRPWRRAGAIAVTAALVAACGNGDDDVAVTDPDDVTPMEATYDGPDIELDFWNGFTGGDGPFMRELVERFNEEHDNITVSMEVQDWGDYYEAVPAAVGTGRGPQIGIMHVDQLATNAARNVVAPLDDLVAVLELDENDFSEPVWNAGEFAGQRYGIPLDVHPLGFYYNRTLMEEAGLDPDDPPTDRDSYMEALDALQDAGIQGSWVSPHLFTGGLMYQALLWQFGGDLYTEDAEEAAWNSPEGVAALEWMVSLVEEGHSPTDVGQDADHIAFMNNENAFIWNGIWMINAYGEDEDLDWDVAPLPVIGDEPAAWAGSHNFVLFEQDDADIRQASLVFFAWILEHSLDWAAGGQVPAADHVREDPALQDLDYIPTFAEMLPNTHFPPSVPGIGDAQGFLATAVNEAVLGEKSPQQALDDAAAAANEVLEENRARFED
jgi:multiple sugar transport system substrate-binding protein